MSFIQIEGNRIHFTTSGNPDNPAIVLLHGFLGNQTTWNQTVQDFSDRYFMITVDLPGHGKSNSLDSVHSMELMAEVVRLVIEELQVNKYHLIGHSMGGYVSLALLDQEESKILSLCLLNSTANADSDIKKKDRIRAIRVFELSRKVFIEEAIENLFLTEVIETKKSEVQNAKDIALNTSLDGVSAALRGMADRPSRVNLLKKVNVPVLFISGVHDNVVPIQSIREIVIKTKAELVELPNSAHMTFIEAYPAMYEALNNFWSNTL